MTRRKFDLVPLLKRWPLALIALAAGACTPAPKPVSTFLPPASTGEVEKARTPVVKKPYDPEVPDAAPTTPVESSALPPVRRR